MTRRLAVALVSFTAAVLLASVLPLGLATAARDRHDYRAGTEELARSLATLADEAFDNRTGPLSPARLAKAAGPNVGVLVLDRGGHAIVTAGRRFVAAPSLIAGAVAGNTVSGSTPGNDANPVAASPVSEGDRVEGVVVVMRLDDPVERRIVRLWLGLGALSAVALAIAVLLAAVAARWVGRPLRGLEATAQRLADGQLGERAVAGSGPPEVRELAEAFNAMAGRLEALVYGSRAVVADVSHQLRTPLAAMRLRLELLREDLDGRGDDDVTAALAEIDRLSRLVDGLLAVARAENADVAPRPIDVTQVVDERRQAWQPVADERAVTIDVAMPGEASFAAVTPGHLEQVLDNVIDNALDALPPGGRIDIAVSDTHGRITVTIADNGRGMTPAQRERAFHRFATGDPDHGTGLGLAIVHRLVTSDGGTVHLDETPGGGTTVVITLPAARAAVASR